MQIFFFESATLVRCIECCVVENIEVEERRYWNISKNKFILCYGRKLEPAAFLSLSYLMQFFRFSIFSILSFFFFFLFILALTIEAFTSLAFPWRENRSETEYQKRIALVRVYKFSPAIVSIEAFIKLAGKCTALLFSRSTRSPMDQSLVLVSRYFKNSLFINFCLLFIYKSYLNTK